MGEANVHKRAGYFLQVVLIGVLIVVGSVIFGARVADAKSVQWNKNVGSLSYPLNGGFLSSVQLAVTYRVRVRDLDSGAVLSPGAEVPQGTRVRFEFLPHAISDVYWFATGNFTDSPYGSWNSGASAPGNMCSNSSNFVQARKGWRSVVHYSVAPPAKTVSGTEGFECSGSGTVRDCTLNTPGAFNPRFNFAQAPGNLWGAVANVNWGGGSCAAGPVLPNGYSNPSFPVPAQSIPFPLTVVSVRGDPPTAPSLTADAQCIVGVPYTIRMTATDPDGDAIRYGVDWTNNGIVNQFVPSSGYVPSGTELSASRTFSSVGTRTIRVMAQDERGLISAWTSHTFTCTQQSEEEADEGSTGGAFEEFITIPPGGGATAGGSLEASLTLRAIPSLVRIGETTNLHWSAANVASCAVTGTNGDSFEGTVSPLEGSPSSPIHSQTTYTLSCIDLDEETITATATVNIVPVFQEI